MIPDYTGEGSMAMGVILPPLGRRSKKGVAMVLLIVLNHAWEWNQ